MRSEEYVFEALLRWADAWPRLHGGKTETDGDGEPPPPPPPPPPPLPDASALLLYGRLLRERREYQGAFEAFDRIVKLGKDFVPQSLFGTARFERAKVLRFIDQERWREAMAEVKDEERKKDSPGALEREPEGARRWGR